MDWRKGMEYCDVLEKVKKIVQLFFGKQYESNDLLSLDSLSFLNMIFEIETEFDIEFDITKIVITDFNKIDKIGVRTYNKLSEKSRIYS